MLLAVARRAGAWFALLPLAAGVVLSCNEKRAQRPTRPPASEPAPPRPSAAASGAPRHAAPPEPKIPVRLAADVDRARLERTLRSVARPRPPGSAHWKRVQALCADALTSAGYRVERHAYGTGVNVLGTRPGRDEGAAQVVVSAHYDHIAGCDGADDNASGVAALLEIARVLSETAVERTLVIGCWDEEERGLLGSRAYSERAKARAELVAAAYSLDGVGFASSRPNTQRVPPGFDSLFPEQAARLKQRQFAGDFIAIVANGASRGVLDSLTRHAKDVNLELFGIELSSLQSLLLRDAYRSDHASFWAQGYPAVLLTDTANFRTPGYHCARGPDSVSSIDFEFVRKVAQATALSALELLGPVAAPP